MPDKTYTVRHLSAGKFSKVDTPTQKEIVDAGFDFEGWLQAGAIYETPAAPAPKTDTPPAPTPKPGDAPKPAAVLGQEPTK